MNKPEPIKEIEQNIQVEAYLDHVEPGQWPRGVVYPDAYVIQSHARHTKPGKALTSTQEARGNALTERLRASLQAALIANGWRPVSQTKAGLPIWQHRPAAQPERQVSPAPAQDVVLEQESGIASDDQASEVRQSEPIYRHTRAVTFTCQWCRQEVTEQRYPSHMPLYCSNPVCKKEATRAKTRERVAAYYKAHPGIRSKKKAR